MTLHGTFPPYQPEPEQQLTGELMRLTDEWEKLGIDPDDFVKCGVCHEYFVDEEGNPIDCKCKEAT